VGKVLLFPVRDKRNEREPDFRGVANIDGTTYEIGIWENQSKRGVPYWSGTIRPPRDRVPDAEPPPQDADIDASFAAVDDAALRREADQSFSDATKSRRW
jgi:hypothetical protein